MPFLVETEWGCGEKELQFILHYFFFLLYFFEASLLSWIGRLLAGIFGQIDDKLMSIGAAWEHHGERWGS